MKAPVPSGAWEAIKSQIPTSGAASTGVGFSSYSFGLAIVAGTSILASLGVYSELKNEDQIVVQESPQLVQMQETVQAEGAEVENSNLVSFEKAEKLMASEPEQVVSTAKSTEEEKLQSETEARPDKDPDKEPNRDSENVLNVPLAPLIKIDSNELSTAHSEQSAQERSPIVASTANQEKDVVKEYRAEILTSAKEGYAPFTVQFNNAANEGESIWDINGISETGNIAETTFEEPGTYEVYLSVYDSEGRIKAQDEIQILVKEGSDIKLPNIFTPNGDGLNDTYRIGYAKNIESFFIQITDETGRVVYTSTDTSEEWVYDQNQGINKQRFTVQYKAIGVDGKIHTDQFPLIIVTD